MTEATIGPISITVAGYQLGDLGPISVVLGKNGCGKSTLLREMDQVLGRSGYTRYITPERGGQLSFDGNVETNMSNNASWANDIRRRNRADNFPQLSVAEFRRLETLVLRTIEQDPAVRADTSFSFDTTVAAINSVLDNVVLARSPTAAFDVTARGSASGPLNSEQLSSGESELVSLATELLAYSYVAASTTYRSRENYLLMDEPDVHLHPDLQYRLMQLLRQVVAERPHYRVVIATHSTAIVSALADMGDVSVAFMKAGQRQLAFRSASDVLKEVLPIFGAHPLSNVFNNKPILLVEGEDDQRIWEQAVRSSGGWLRVWPCVAGDVQSLNNYEQTCADVIGAVYDNATALSVRDRDAGGYALNDLGPVKRAKLNCYAAENLLLSDDVLQSLSQNWQSMTSAFDAWLVAYPSHPQYSDMKAFKDGGYDRRDAKIKSLRNVIMMLAGSEKPWEVAIGQCIAGVNGTNAAPPDSLRDFLGPKLLAMIGA